MAEIEKVKPDFAMLDDGARVSWSSLAMTCTCTVARKCDPNEQMCQHIALCLREKVDRLLTAQLNTSVFKLCVLLPMTKGSEKPVFVQVILTPTDGGLLRGVTVPMVDNDSIVCFVQNGTARLDLREMIWPTLVEFAVTGDMKCRVCPGGQPTSITMFRTHGQRDTAAQVAAVRDALSIHSNNLCVNHDDTDLIPPF